MGGTEANGRGVKGETGLLDDFDGLGKVVQNTKQQTPKPKHQNPNTKEIPNFKFQTVHTKHEAPTARRQSRHSHVPRSRPCYSATAETTFIGTVRCSGIVDLEVGAYLVFGVWILVFGFGRFRSRYFVPHIFHWTSVTPGWVRRRSSILRAVFGTFQQGCVTEGGDLSQVIHQEPVQVLPDLTDLPRARLQVR